MCDLVVFLRDADERGEYVAAAHARGACAAHVRVLSFAPENEAALAAIARSGGAGYGGLVVTSSQAAAALSRACAATAGGAPAALAALPAWAVGAQTARAMAGLGVVAQAAASAEELLPLLCAAWSGAAAAGAPPPLLYLTGSKRLEVLPSGMRARGVAFEELLVYRTELLAADGVDAGLAAALQAGSDAPRCAHAAHRRLVLVIFSPSGLDSLSGELAHTFLQRAAASTGPPLAGGVEQVLLVAFGKTTAAALTARGLPVAATTRSPDAAGVGDALAELGYAREAGR